MKMKPIWYKSFDEKTKANIEKHKEEYWRQNARIPNAWPGTITAIIMQLACWAFGLWLLWKIFHWLFG